MVELAPLEPPQELTSWQQAVDLERQATVHGIVISPLPTVVGHVEPTRQMRIAFKRYVHGDYISLMHKVSYNPETDEASLTGSGPVTGSDREAAPELTVACLDTYKKIGTTMLQDATQFLGESFESPQTVALQIYGKNEKKPILRKSFRELGMGHTDPGCLRYLWIMGEDPTNHYVGRFRAGRRGSQSTDSIRVADIQPIRFAEGDIVRFYPTSVHSSPDTYSGPRLAVRGSLSPSSSRAR